MYDVEWGLSIWQFSLLSLLLLLLMLLLLLSASAVGSIVIRPSSHTHTPLHRHSDNLRAECAFVYWRTAAADKLINENCIAISLMSGYWFPSCLGHFSIHLYLLPWLPAPRPPSPLHVSCQAHRNKCCKPSECLRVYWGNIIKISWLLLSYFPPSHFPFIWKNICLNKNIP